MEKVRIKNLFLSNFKGIKQFEIADFNGGISIYGDNATGKTTIFDGFNWLLFGKDSLNSAAFEIKPLTGSGEPLHGLEHEVSSILVTSAGEVELRKVFSEKYTKRRGESQKTFTGHTVDHFVDGVPCKQKEFNAAVNKICTEDAFRLLTNPRYFNEVLHWTDRRKLLLEVCGNIADEDVIATSDELKTLPDIIGKHAIEDAKKINAARRAELNRELQKIPTRIDEIAASKVEVTDDADEILKKVEVYKQRKILQEQEILQLKSGGGIAEKEKKMAEIDSAIIKIRNGIDQAFNECLSLQRQEINLLLNKADAAARATENEVIKQTDQMKTAKVLAKKIEGLIEKREALRAKWFEVDGQTMVAAAVAGETICPACGQKLPAEKIAEARALAEAAFNEKKAADLKEISEKGKLITAEIEELETEHAQVKNYLAGADDKIKQLAGAQDAAENAVDDMRAEHERINGIVAPNPDLDKLEADKQQIQLEINGLRAGTYESVLAAEAELDRLNSLLNLLSKDDLQIKANLKVDKRIAELEAQERALAAEFENLEADIFVIETFIRTKVAMLEDRINKKFEHATFRLFTENINGGLEECCDTVFRGVPYTSMNNAARINVGLDICNTLSEYYGISLPVFIDSAESITDILKTEAQQIRLIVSEKDKKLRIEKTPKKEQKNG